MTGRAGTLTPSCAQLPRRHQRRGDTWGEGKGGARRLSWGEAGFGGATTLQWLDRNGPQTQCHRTRRDTRCWDECREPRGHLGLKSETGTQKRNGGWAVERDTEDGVSWGWPGAGGGHRLEGRGYRKGHWAWGGGGWRGPRAGSGRWVRGCLCEGAGGCGLMVGDNVQGSGTPREQGGWGVPEAPCRAGHTESSTARPQWGHTCSLWQGLAHVPFLSFPFGSRCFWAKVTNTVLKNFTIFLTPVQLV